MSEQPEADRTVLLGAQDGAPAAPGTARPAGAAGPRRPTPIPAAAEGARPASTPGLKQPTPAPPSVWPTAAPAPRARRPNRLLLAAIPVVLLTLVGLALVLSSAAGRLQTTPEPTPVPPTATAPPTAPPPTFAATVTPVLVAAATLTPATPTPVPPSATPVVVVTKEIVVTREIVVVTATPEPTSTPAPTVTPLPTALPAPTEPPAPTAGPGVTFPPPVLVSPKNDDSTTGQVVFTWTWSGPALGPDYGFEVRLWKEGQPDHYGAAEPVNDTSVTINLRGAYGVRAGGEGAYWWTVAVVQRQPYTRVGAEAAPRKLNVQIAGGLPSTPTPIP